MNGINSDSNLNKLDDEFQEAVLTALKESPEELRAKLAEMGFIDEYACQSDSQDTTNVENLTESEVSLLNFVQTIEEPEQTTTIIKMMERERPEIPEKYSSATNRSWVSNKLTKFAQLGLIGKFRSGQTVKYTSDIEEAIRRWALHNNILIQDIDNTYADQIVMDTGMNRNAVIREITQMETD